MSPETSKPTRQLATVLVADAVGFSRHMGENEQAALTALLECRDLLTESVEARRGRTIGTPGDFLLALMPNSLEAVECALQIQDLLIERNLHVAEQYRVEYRIGIAVGDIYESDGDALGDAVNIASRLQAIAVPGGIVTSGAVHDIVVHGEDFEFEYLGDQPLKNLVMPVRCFAVVRARKGSQGRGKRSRLVDRPPVKPVVEIEEFRARSGAGVERLFADAFTEELVTFLASLSNSLIVRAPPNLEAVRGDIGGYDAPKLYRLKGSVHRAGNKTQIVAQLNVRGSGDTIWADRFDYDGDQSFDALDLIAREVVTAIQVTLTEGDQAQFWRQGTTNVRAWEMFQRGHDFERRFTREGHEQARAAYESALVHYPSYVSAIVALAFCHLDEIRLGWTADIDGSFANAETLYQLANGLNAADPQCYALQAYLELHRRNDSGAVLAMEQAVRLAPRSGELTAYLAYIYETVGRYDDAIEAYSRAMQLSIHCPAWISTNLGFTLCAVDRLSDAQHIFLGVARNQPNYVRAYIGLVVVYRRQGLAEDALKVAAEIRRLDPLFTIDSWAQDRPYSNPDITQGIMADLRSAGLK